MSFDDAVLRDDAAALMPEEVSNIFLRGLTNMAGVFNLFTNIPCGRRQVRFPVLSSLPIAYFVNGDTGLKSTTKVDWRNKFLNIEEVAVIVPIPDNVIDDSDQPIWDQVRPLCEQAAARTVDAAAFFGAGAPSSWPTSVEAAARAVGNTARLGTTRADAGGIVGDHSAMLSALEDDGYDVGSGIAARSIRGAVRQARNAQGDRYGEVSISRDGVEIDGVSYTHPMRGMWPSESGSTQAIALDSSEFVVAIRQDITWKLLDQAVITDNDGNIVYNLPQQDMTAMRMVLRCGWQVANTVNYDEPDEDARYPAGLLLKA